MLENVRIREAWLRLFVPVTLYVQFNKNSISCSTGITFCFGTDVRWMLFLVANYIVHLIVAVK